MISKLPQRIFFTIITLTLFSLWAGFALLVVNKLFYKDLPGYTIGRICMWEVVAMIIAIVITKLLIRRWGNIELIQTSDATHLKINSKFAIYLTTYFFLAVFVGIWQFWLFSQQF